jgi:p-cumate 2,3-dioxygenase subunit alpha
VPGRDAYGDDLDMASLGLARVARAESYRGFVFASFDPHITASTHDTYFKYLVSLGTDLSVGVSGVTKDLGNGHAVLEYLAPWGRPIARWEPLFGAAAKEEIAALRARLAAEHGAERARRMCDLNRNMLIYPNLIINDIMAVMVRTFMPTSATAMTVTAWEAAPQDELPEVRQRRLDSFLT